MCVVIEKIYKHVFLFLFKDVRREATLNFSFEVIILNVPIRKVRVEREVIDDDIRIVFMKWKCTLTASVDVYHTTKGCECGVNLAI